MSVRFGLTMSVLPRFDAKLALDAIEADRVSVLAGVPTMLQALAAENLAGRDLSRLRVAVSGGASLPAEILRDFEDRLGIVVLEGYGLSETASSASFNRSAEQRKPLSIGLPMWGVQMRAVDSKDQPLPAGEANVGQIVIRGHNVMKGYRGKPDATAAAMLRRTSGRYALATTCIGDGQGIPAIVEQI
jgi:long-chain acyl-CoA synthetase